LKKIASAGLKTGLRLRLCFAFASTSFAQGYKIECEEESMFQARRPAGRLFYLVVAVVVAAWGVRPAACAEGSAGKAEKPAISPEAEPRAKGPAARGGFALPPERWGANERDRHGLHGGWIGGTRCAGDTWPAFVTASGAGWLREY